MPTVPVLTRDLALDQNLESEARLTLILVAAGLGVLILATLVVLFGYRLLGFFRFPSRQPAASATTCADTLDTAEVQKPETASFVSTDINMPFNQPHGTGAAYTTPPPNTPKSKIPFLLSSMRKHSSAPHRPMGIYTGFGRSPSQLPRPSGSATESQTSQTQSPSYITPPPLHTRKTGFAVPQPGIVTPHIAGWMKIADAVVGRHPDAKPLHARVATQADIDLISGHLHMPWATFNDDDQARAQPMPVKVLRPDTRDTTPVFQAPPAPEILKDVGNTRARVVLVSVNSGSNSKKDQKRPLKGRSPRSAFGKENIPAAPSSSLLQAQAVFGRRT